MPATYDAQLAQLVRKPPDGDAWLHEIKFDGYRIGAFVRDGDVCLISRNQNDWSDRFATVRAALRKLKGHQVLLDGEIAVVQADGRTSFQQLQNIFSGDSHVRVTYFVFDLLHLDGEDLTSLALEQRKQRLQALVEQLHDPTVRYSDHVLGHGAEFFANACRHGLEGIISKQREARYAAGRSSHWLKTKCIRRQEFVIGGFTEPQGSRAGLGALLVGVQQPGRGLVFAGKVGTGFTNRSARALRQQLDRLEQGEPPFALPHTGLPRNAHWVQPRLVAEIAFSEWTDDGKIRHPSFQGLRADKAATEVMRESTAPPAPPSGGRAPAHPRGAGTAVTVAGMRLTHPERVLWPEAHMTKLDLARYYEDIADWILPHVQGRPLTLVRCPDGVGTSCFYMKHSLVWAPSAIRRVRIPEKKKVGEYLVADSLAALVGLAQMDVLEIHTWNSTIDHLEQLDRLVLDLDPGPAVRWPAVVAAAKLLRELLASLGLQSFVKTTGGKGLHVVVPLEPVADWTVCFAFSRSLAEMVVASAPGQYTTSMPKAGRESKILIDYLRNNRTNTSVAAFSTRATPAATVSVPLAWAELSGRLRSDHFTVSNVRARLRKLHEDPWKEYGSTRQRITPELSTAVRRTIR